MLKPRKQPQPATPTQDAPKAVVPKSQPTPLEPERQRQVGGGTGPSLPNKGW